MNHNNYVSSRERERERSKSWLWIILGIVLIAGLGTGIYFFTQQSSSENPQEDQSHQEKEAKEKMLEKYQAYFTEQDLPALISQTSYLGANFPSSTLEEIVDRNLEIMKQKKLTLFPQFPANTQEFKEGYKRGENNKIEFLYVSLIPRKSDGKIDWIKWQKQDEKEDKLFTTTEIKSYLENKINPALKSWYDDFSPEPDPVKRLTLINQQIDKHLSIQKTTWLLYKIGKEKGWIDKEYYKQALKPSYKDASGSQVKINFDLVLEYNVSKWN